MEVIDSKKVIFAALAALLFLASCQKNDPTGIGTSPVFIATIAGATKTSVNVSDGKVSWEASDEITVSDASSASAVYTVESIDETTGKATFVIKAGETGLGDGPYTATYGTEPATEQTYSATAGKLYMTAPATSDNSFTFTVQCGLMKINLTKIDESVKSITVTRTSYLQPLNSVYTLVCNPAQSISYAKDFYIALPEGKYSKIEITNESGITCTLNSASGILVAANHIKPVTFDGSKLSFTTLPLYALPGKFSVAENKQVHFACGNLYAKRIDAFGVSTWMWRIYNNQYDCNSLNTGVSRTATEEDTEIDLFIWGYDATKPLLPTGNVYYSSDVTTLNNRSDWGGNIAGAVWRTPTIEEWQYLFTGRANASSHYKSSVTVCGKPNCVVIAPDYWDITICPLQDEYSDSSSPMTWAEAQEAGLVCLPAAGRRDGSGVSNVGVSGNYWSSSSYDSGFAYYMHYSSSDIEKRSIGCSVRLITECQ